MAFTVNILLQNGHHESNDHQVLRVEDFRKIVFELLFNCLPPPKLKTTNNTWTGKLHLLFSLENIC